ncbi:hypothetical protein Ddc_13996 [Ditylenchus destructor]|nr:hypothetical protein Ddc_13996 [Ditylenchus destructor]
MLFRESAAEALPPPAGSSSHIGSERVLVVTYVTDPPALDYNSRVELSGNEWTSSEIFDNFFIPGINFMQSTFGRFFKQILW